MVRIGIIDYGMGNLASVVSALDQISVNGDIISSPSELINYDHIILPGVGSFRKAMENLRADNWEEAIRDSALEGKNVLGICLGMHLLASLGTEHGETEGLNLIPGKIIHFNEIIKSNLLVPHVGWNEIHLKDLNHPVFNEVADKTDFYFVHSFIYQLENSSNTGATTPYGCDFPSIAIHDNIIGMQFHPEKSGPAGLKLLENFSRL